MFHQAKANEAESRFNPGAGYCCRHWLGDAAWGRRPVTAANEG